MPIQTVIDIPGEFVWIDCFELKKDELSLLSERFKLPTHLIEDALEPEHLPKFEISGKTRFFIFRAYDEHVKSGSVTVQQITRKIAVFIGDDFIFTLHRLDQPFLQAFKEKIQVENVEPKTCANLKKYIFDELLHAIFTTYDNPIDKSFGELEHFESAIFNSRRPRRSSLRRGYVLKRRSSVMKRMLKTSLDIILRSTSSSDLEPSRIQELKERLESLLYYADELEDQVTSLLNLHLSLASHYTNEVVRVLTVFSIFFLPLNFIAGIYGMNFDFMPEVKWQFGYFFALTLMSAVALGIFIWFKRKGLLGSRE